MKGIVTAKNIFEYIPQRPPMAMVDTLYRADELSAVSGLHLSKQNIFCENGRFTEPGIIENIAQTAALHSGYMARKNNTRPAVGFIGAIKRLTVYSLPLAGELLETTITVVSRFDNATIIKGEVKCNGRLIAEGEMNIFLQNNKKAKA